MSCEALKFEIMQRAEQKCANLSEPFSAVTYSLMSRDCCQPPSFYSGPLTSHKKMYNLKKILNSNFWLHEHQLYEDKNALSHKPNKDKCRIYQDSSVT